ncbi:MAG: hypothetical protein IPP19_05355 [Verrucomicrobia bacterium]|nr:hypothetical protein [Verrucomicrobiota bacterium]
MKTFIRLALALAATVLSVTSLRAGDPSTGYFEAIEKEAAPVVGETYFMRHCIRYEAGKDWETTNYWTDSSILVPINSKVTLTSLGSKTMQIKVEKTGLSVTIENIQKYSQKDMATIAKTMLTRKEVTISNLDEKTQKNIRNGMLALGMTKEQVVMTRGFPPQHKTPSLEVDTWTFWNNRFVTHALVFEDGILARARGLQ